MTKLYERFFRGALSEAVSFYGEEPARGEFTIVLVGAPQESGVWDKARVQSALAAGMDGNVSPSQLARQVSADSGWKRSDVYDLLRAMGEE